MYTDLVVSGSGPCRYISLPEYADIHDGEDASDHYTPMWFPDGEYSPVTTFRGIWTPVGEMSAVIRQNEIGSAAEMERYGIFTNGFRISGSLYDDLYMTRY